MANLDFNNRGSMRTGYMSGVERFVVPTRSQSLLVNVRTQVSVQPQPSRALANEFRKHEQKWMRETKYMSSLTDKYLHPSYARIIGMGERVVPHILRSMEQSPNDWFYALRAITGENPVSSPQAGDMDRMTRAWLAWGKRRKLI
jgi:hypothetical protein